MRAGAVGVELLAGQLPLPGDQLGAHPLRDEAGEARAHRRAERVGALPGRAHRHPAHRLDAGRDHQVVGAGHDALHGEVDRLLAGAALALDRGGRHVHREARRQPGLTAGGGGLLAVLPDAADEDVVHRAGVDAVPLDDGAQQLGEQVNGMHVGQRATLLAAAHGERMASTITALLIMLPIIIMNWLGGLLPDYADRAADSLRSPEAGGAPGGGRAAPGAVPRGVVLSGCEATALLAAVDGDHGAGRIAGRVAGQVQGGAHDLDGLSAALQREATGPFRKAFLIPGLAHIGEERPGHDRVAAHGRAEGVRQPGRERVEPGLGRRVGQHVRSRAGRRRRC